MLNDKQLFGELKKLKTVSSETTISILDII